MHLILYRGARRAVQVSRRPGQSRSSCAFPYVGYKANSKDGLVATTTSPVKIAIHSVVCDDIVSIAAMGFVILHA